MEKTAQQPSEYATIWSRSLGGGLWVIERSHTRDYIAAAYGVGDGEFIEHHGRQYVVRPFGEDPNR